MNRLLDLKEKGAFNLSVLEILLNLIFPKVCLGCSRLGEYLCSECEEKIKAYKTSFCPVCGRAAIGGFTHPKCTSRYCLSGVTCLFDYSGPLQKILHQIKYRFSSRLVEVFDDPLMKVNLPTNLKGFELLALPLNQKRENWRGFNQAELIGKAVAEKFSIPLVEGLLQRKTFEKSQVKLSLEQRKKNLQGAFIVVDPKKVEGKKILLFDDVWTTGATLTEAGKTLKKAGADQVWALTLASSHRV